MKLKKVILMVSLVAVFGLGFMFNTQTAQAQTAAELRALIAQLQDQIAQLQQQLAQIQEKPAVWCHDFNVTLKYGDRGEEVKALQTALKKQGLLSDEELKGEAGYFGENTAAAVVDFQLKYKDEISKYAGYSIRASGVFGKGTRAKLNELYGCGMVTPITPVAPVCQMLWWYDNDHQYCQQKQFCGYYMYLGLRTFKIKAECEADLIKSTCTQKDGSCCLGDVCSTSKVTCVMGATPVFKGCDANCNPEWECQPSIWDISARFDKAHCNDFYPFSTTTGEIGTTYYANLDGSSDNLYTEFQGASVCLEGGCRTYWGPLYEKDKATRMGPWVGERKYVHKDNYKILIRGASKPDCACGGNGYVKGEVVVNSQSEWKIAEVVRCQTNSDTRGREVYCRVDKESGVISFAGGSTCGGCCCCIDSAQIDIEVKVTKGKVVVPTCTDSDGGKNYYVKGRATGSFVATPSSPTTATDFCLGGPQDPQSNILVEYYCGGDGYIYSTHYTCPYGCSDGACKINPTANIWINRGEDQYTLNKENEEVSQLFKEGAASECDEFEKEQTYYDIPFDTGQKMENGQRGRLNLEFDNQITLPLNKSAKYIYGFALGNTGNVYLDTRVYVYKANVSLTINYVDGTSEKLTAILPWDWSTGRDYTGENTETIHLKESPCRIPEHARELYMLKFINPQEGKLITSLTFKDDFTADYPRTNIFAVTLSNQSEERKSITVLSPNGGERWVAGQTYDIVWKSSGMDKVNIYYREFVPNEVIECKPCMIGMYCPSCGYQLIAEDISASSGKYSWIIPNNLNISDKYKVAVSMAYYEGYKTAVSDESDNYFSIVATGVNLPPVIDGLSAPSQLKVNETGTWTIKAHDPENGRLTYSVRWGDEVSSLTTEQRAFSAGAGQTTTFTHSYGRAGNYTITFTVTDDQSQSAKTSTTVEVVSGSEEICGDVNGDKVVNNNDRDLLMNYVGYPGQYTISSEWAADVTCDGKIDVGDVVLLQNYVGYPGKYVLKCCR